MSHLESLYANETPYEPEDIEDIQALGEALENSNYIEEPSINTNLIVKPHVKPTCSIFERTQMITKRALQLETGAPSLLNEVEGMSPIEIAEEEFRQRVIPVVVTRTYPGGYKKTYTINDFSFIHEEPRGRIRRERGLNSFKYPNE
jgi:DNA-directed RNA polymerase subunit K/omega